MSCGAISLAAYVQSSHALSERWVVAQNETINNSKFQNDMTVTQWIQFIRNRERILWTMPPLIFRWCLVYHSMAIRIWFTCATSKKRIARRNQFSALVSKWLCQQRKESYRTTTDNAHRPLNFYFRCRFFFLFFFSFNLMAFTLYNEWTECGCFAGRTIQTSKS